MSQVDARTAVYIYPRGMGKCRKEIAEAATFQLVQPAMVKFDRSDASREINLNVDAYPTQALRMTVIHFRV